MSIKKCSSSLNSIAFVEFKKESMVKKIMRKNPKIKIQDRVLIMNFVGKANRSEGTETKGKKEADGKRMFENTYISLKKRKLRYSLNI